MLEVDASGVVVEIGSGSGSADDHAEVLIPGLVNAHSHLDLEAIEGAPRAEFTAWLRAVIAQRRTSDAGQRTLIERNLSAAIATGTLAFGDIDGTGATAEAMLVAGVAGRAYREVLGLAVDETRAEALVGEARGGRAVEVDGLSPHAPYSVSPALLRAAVRSNARLAIHLAETEEEVRFLRDGTGPLASLLADLGVLPDGWAPPRCSPVAWARAQGALGPRVLLVHLQHPCSGDLDLVASSGSPVVVCPGTVRWFDRGVPPVEELCRRGVCVCLGTDSVASNEGGLDMMAEMATLRRLCPSLLPTAVLTMATARGGEALGLPVGRIIVGCRLDALAFDDVPAGTTEGATDWLTAAAPSPDRLVTGGNPCSPNVPTL